MKTLLRLLISLALLVSLNSYAQIDHRLLAQQEWLEITSDNVTIITDGDAEVGQAMAEKLELFRHFIASYLGIEGNIATTNITILALAEEKSFNALDLPENMAGVFLTDGDGSFAIANTTGYSTNNAIQTVGNHTVMHEYVHFASQTLFGNYNYPVWYSEGVAEYLATFREVQKGTHFEVGNWALIGQRANELRVGYDNSFELIDIEDLLKSSSTKLSWRDEQKGYERSRAARHELKFYARAVMAYHYLHSTPFLRDQLDHYIELLNRGLEVDTAFDIAFNGIGYAALDIAIQDYIQTGQNNAHTYTSVDGEPLFGTAKTQVRELNKDEAIKTLTTFMLRAPYQTLDDRWALLRRIQEDYPVAPELMYSELLLIEKTDNHELPDAIERMLSLYPDYIPFKVLDASIKSFSISLQVEAGSHDTAAQVRDIRYTLREALFEDKQNTRAYGALSRLSSITHEATPRYLEEACIAGESLRLLLADYAHYLRHELDCRVKRGDIDTTTLILRKLATIDDSDWIKTGYGRFVLDSFNLRELALSEPEYGSAMELSYPDGSVYYGDIINDRPHGQGVFESARNGTAEGYWEYGKLVDATEFKSSNGYRYEGNYDDGAINGQGLLYYPNGNIHRSQGRFVLGFAHGKHKQYFHSGLTLHGNVHMNQRLGMFDVRLPDGESGEVEMIHERAKIQIPDGSDFIGEFETDGYFTGNGLCYRPLIEEITGCVLNEPPLILYKNP